MLHHFRHCTHTLAPPHLVETLCAGESCSEESGREIGRDDRVLLPFPRGPLRGPVFLRFPCNQSCCARAPYSSARLFQRVCKRCPYRLGPPSASRRPLQLLALPSARPDDGVEEQIAEFFFRVTAKICLGLCPSRDMAHAWSTPRAHRWAHSTVREVRRGGARA